MSIQHHNRLVEELRKHQLAAGGPISLTQLLRLSRATIGDLRSNRVNWDWIAPRILAVHQTTFEALIPDDMPLAAKRSTRLISSLWSRTGASNPSDVAVVRVPVEQAPLFDQLPTSVKPATNGENKQTGPPALLRVLQDHEISKKLGNF